MSFLYHTFIFDPLYNALILIFNLAPWVDAGIAVIILTIIVRLILFPLSKKAVVTQVRMNEISPELAKIKEEHKDNTEEQARKTMELFRKNKVNPFSGILIIIIQIPIIFALYQIFLHFPEINNSVLYSFIHAPSSINPTFLGFLDITAKSLPLAFFAALTTYLQFHVSSRGQKKPEGNSFGDNLSRSMQTQMKYIFPVLVFFISHSISGVIALYWLTTNVFSILQELIIRKNIKPIAT